MAVPLENCKKSTLKRFKETPIFALISRICLQCFVQVYLENSAVFTGENYLRKSLFFGKLQASSLTLPEKNIPAQVLF